MTKQEEIRKLKLLYNVISDETVQDRFFTTTTVNRETGEMSQIRLIDECEDYIITKLKANLPTTKIVVLSLTPTSQAWNSRNSQIIENNIIITVNNIRNIS